MWNFSVLHFFVLIDFWKSQCGKTQNQVSDNRNTYKHGEAKTYLSLDAYHSPSTKKLLRTNHFFRALVLVAMVALQFLLRERLPVSKRWPASSTISRPLDFRLVSASSGISVLFVLELRIIFLVLCAHCLSLSSTFCLLYRLCFARNSDPSHYLPTISFKSNTLFSPGFFEFWNEIWEYT